MNIKDISFDLIENTNPRYVGICVKTKKYLKLIVIPTLGDKDYNHDIVEEEIEELNESSIYTIFGGITLDAISVQYLNACLDFKKGDNND